MKWIADCKGAWKHYSTLGLAFAGGIGVTWHSLPDWVTAQLPAWTGKAAAWSMTVAALGGLFGKFVDQSKPEGKPDDPA